MENRIYNCYIWWCGYFGAPDVVITGDGVGATAFAQVDLSSNIVTGIVITNKV